MLQATARLQHTVPTIVPEALDQCMALLESSHDLTQRDRLGRPRQAETAAGAALSGDESAFGEVVHHFGEMVAGKSLELRSATDLAVLYISMGRRDSARELLGPVDAMFSSATESPDLKAARSLLERASS